MQVVDARTLRPVEDVKGREALIAVVRCGDLIGSDGKRCILHGSWPSVCFRCCRTLLCVTLLLSG